MSRIIIETVPPDKMRMEAYRESGCGDWFRDENGDVRIQVASNGDVWENEEAFLVALHETIEARLCHKDGVTQADVDAFDAAFAGTEQPGDDPKAPYQRQHRAAMLIEHLMATFLGNWRHGAIE